MPVAAAVVLLAATPALAVGLAPLAKQGMTAGPAKAFWLTVINPYAQSRVFRAYVDSSEAGGEGGGERAGGAEKIAILPATVTIKPGGQRRIAVILRDLAPGETREARICAELAQHEGMIHSRVCSRLSATRLAPRA